MKPVLQALLLADHIYEDKTTGKKVVAGIFHQLCYIPRDVLKAESEKQGGSIPVIRAGYQSGSPFAYFSLTDIHPGDQEFTARYVDLHDDRVWFQIQVKLNVEDRLQVAEVIIPLPVLPAFKPGVFAFELLWHDEPLGSYRVNVVEGSFGGPNK